MVTIINAVECNNYDTLKSVIDLYVDTCGVDCKLLTDDKRIHEYGCQRYGNSRCIYQENIVSLWLKATDKTVIILTDIVNTCSTVYDDIVAKYSVICIEDDVEEVPV